MPSLTPDTKHVMNLIIGGIEKTGLTWYRMINGTPTRILWGGEPTGAPAYTPNPSNGRNGEFKDTLANSYTSGSLTSLYHIRAAHVADAWITPTVFVSASSPSR